MNKLKLKATIMANGDTQGTLSSYLGISEQSLSARVNGHKEFTQGEIIMIKKKYGLSAEEVDSIFFGDYVS